MKVLCVRSALSSFLNLGVYRDMVPSYATESVIDNVSYNLLERVTKTVTPFVLE